MYIDLEVLAINGKGGKPFVSSHLHILPQYSATAKINVDGSNNTHSKESKNPLPYFKAR